MIFYASPFSEMKSSLLKKQKHQNARLIWVFASSVYSMNGYLDVLNMDINDDAF